MSSCVGVVRVAVAIVLCAVFEIAVGNAEQQSPPDKGSVVVIKAGAIVVGVAAVSCTLVPRVRKMCREGLLFLLRTNDNVGRHGKAVDVSEIDKLHRDIDQLKDDAQLLADETKKIQLTADENLRSMLGRQANFNGFAFENATAEALPRLLNELFPKLQMRNIVRNVEGYYRDGDNIRRLEFDTIAISDQHVFVFESKIGLKRNHIDKFVKKLNNFSQITFDDKSLNKQLYGKNVHGGLSYMFDGKWSDKDNLERVYLVSRYAREQKKLLTIHRLNSAISDNLNLSKLYNFNKAKVKREKDRRLRRNSRWR